MAKHKRIAVVGSPRTDIDPMLLLQLLLAISDAWERGEPHLESVDTFDASIEDHLSESDAAPGPNLSRDIEPAGES